MSLTLIKPISHKSRYRDERYYFPNVENKNSKHHTICGVIKSTIDGTDVIIMVYEYGYLQCPGGKVESYDKNVYDTLWREIWEEIFMEMEFDGHDSYVKSMAAASVEDQELMECIKKSTDLSDLVECRCCALQTVYIKISLDEDYAKKLLKRKNMFAVPVYYITTIFEHNQAVSFLKNKLYDKFVIAKLVKFVQKETYYGDMLFYSRDFSKFNLILDTFWGF